MGFSQKFMLLSAVCIICAVSFSYSSKSKAKEAKLGAGRAVKNQNIKIDYDESAMLHDPEHTIPITTECSPKVNCAFKTYNKFGDISGTIVYCGRCSEGYECRLIGNNLQSCFLTYTCEPEQQEGTESSNNTTEAAPEVIIPEEYANVWPRVVNLTAEAAFASPRRGRDQDLSNCADTDSTHTKRDGDILDVHEL